VITMLKRTRPSKNHREVTPTDRGRSRLERGLLAIMGPPQLGEDKPREGYVPDEAANLCHKCGQPWDAHGRVHTANLTYRPCPAPQG
jgi:hypothetical protein